METIPTPLIEKALALTGKTTDNVEVFTWSSIGFSIEKFWWYLLSDNFLRSYLKSNYQYSKASEDKRVKFVILKYFSRAIYEYQSGDSSRLIKLLSII